MIDRRILVAPREHGALLVAPAIGDLLGALRGACSSIDGARVLGTAVGEWRRSLRERLDLAGPIVATGHQTEFFHAGVFAKNMMAGELARRSGGTAVFLGVDSDLPKTLSLSVAQRTPAGPRRVAVEIPALRGDVPFEDQPAAPRQHWLDFFFRLSELAPQSETSLLRVFADAWLADGDTLDLVPALLRALSAAEAALGVRPLRQIRVSALSATPEFRVFAADILLNAPRFADAYNRAQGAYRERHRVRHAGRPVPPMGRREARVETPFWVQQRGSARRRLWVERDGTRVALFADAAPLGAIEVAALSDAATHAAPWPIERDGWRIRPRALALSAFARLVLCDLFLHGIGGAKYDEVTDDFARDYYGAPLPALGCISATLHLPLARSGASEPQAREARRLARDLRYNPQRYVRAAPPALLRRREELLRRAGELRGAGRAARGERRAIFIEFQQIRQAMLATDPWRAAEFDRRVADLEQSRALDQIAADREYFFALHQRNALEALGARVRAAVES